MVKLLVTLFVFLACGLAGSCARQSVTVVAQVSGAPATCAPTTLGDLAPAPADAATPPDAQAPPDAAEPPPDASCAPDPTRPWGGCFAPDMAAASGP